MAHCPKCGVENPEESRTCTKCGAALPAARQAGLSPREPPGAVGLEEPDEAPRSTSGRTKVVRVFRGPTAQMEAELAKNVLEEEGIPCVMPGEEMASVLPGVDIVQLFVREEDAEEAAEILKDFFDSPQPTASEDSST